MPVRRLLGQLWRGAGLRHLPIAVLESSPPSVRFELHGEPGGPRDVTDHHVPVSLRPLILGLRIDQPGGAADMPPSGRSLVVRDAATGERLAAISLTVAGTLPLMSGSLSLFRPTSCRTVAVPARVRWWRYALAAVHARRASSRGDRLCMSASDLRCLNVYYMFARRVFLIGVALGERTNLFPMDLVGSVGSGEYLLALRATSPAIDLMEGSRTIAMSAAPAGHLSAVYALGAHHRLASVDVTALPFAVSRSPLHGLPVLASGFTRELTVVATHRIGSHVLFVCRVDREQGSTERQIAHVSQMYAEWLAKRGRSVEALA
jgi:flavin reductase (DIM6/NTAB) family NADH-FMN oxidoreductase RutF